MIRSTVTRLLCVATGLIPLAACNCGGPTLTCGPGTVASNGQCVPVGGGEGEGEGEGEGGGLTCGPGTHEVGAQCLPDGGGEGEGEGEGGGLTCGPGTIQQGNECVPDIGTDISADAASTGLVLDFDAAPSPDGATLFYVAQVTDPTTGDLVHSLFSVPADASAGPTAIASGFVLPLNIAVSLDGSHVFVADAGFQEQASDDPSEGTIFSVNVASGAKTELTNVFGYRVRGLDVLDNGGNEVVLFTGTDPADGQRGVFQTDAAGGTINVIQKGDAFTDPSGVAAVSINEIYVTDTSGSDSGRGALLKVTATTTTVEAADLDLGYPAGVAVTLDGKIALVSGLNTLTDSSQVYEVNLANGAVSTTTTGLAGNNESGGVHRASNLDVFAWADLTAGGQGTVFRITLR